MRQTKVHAFTGAFIGTTFCGLSVSGSPKVGYEHNRKPIKTTRDKKLVTCKTCKRCEA